MGPGEETGQEPVPPAPEPTAPAVLRAGPRTPAPLTWMPTAPCSTPHVSIPRNTASESMVFRELCGSSGKEAGPYPGGVCPGRARGGSPAPSRSRRGAAEGLLHVRVPAGKHSPPGGPGLGGSQPGPSRARRAHEVRSQSPPTAVPQRPREVGPFSPKDELKV